MRFALLALLAACDSGRPATPSRPAPPLLPAPADAMRADAALIEDGDPIETAVNAAFAGHPPMLPALSPDGNHAAIDRSEWLGESSIHDYKVALLDTKGVFGKPWVVLDAKLGEALLQDNAPPLPMPELTQAASNVTKQLAGYTPFAAPLDFEAIEEAHGTIALATTTLRAERVDGKRLTLRWLDANGVLIRQETIAAIPREARDTEGGRCGGTPRLTRLWFAPPRRLLLQIVFPGSDSCTDEPVQWRLW